MSILKIIFLFTKMGVQELGMSSTHNISLGGAHRPSKMVRWEPQKVVPTHYNDVVSSFGIVWQVLSLLV